MGLGLLFPTFGLQAVFFQGQVCNADAAASVDAAVSSCAILPVPVLVRARSSLVTMTRRILFVMLMLGAAASNARIQVRLLSF